MGVARWYSHRASRVPHGQLNKKLPSCIYIYIYIYIFNHGSRKKRPLDKLTKTNARNNQRPLGLRSGCFTPRKENNGNASRRGSSKKPYQRAASLHTFQRKRKARVRSQRYRRQLSVRRHNHQLLTNEAPAWAHQTNNT